MKIKHTLVILNLFQDLSKNQATHQIGKMLKQVQHDILIDIFPQIHHSKRMQKGLYGLDYIVSTKVREVSSKLDTEPIYANKINYICFILRCPPIKMSDSEIKMI